MPYPRSRVMVGRDAELSHLLELAVEARRVEGRVPAPDLGELGTWVQFADDPPAT